MQKMTTKQTALLATDTIAIGDTFTTCYSNGQVSGVAVVVRVTESSIFWNRPQYINDTTPTRESRKTIARYIEKGIWLKK